MSRRLTVHGQPYTVRKQIPAVVKHIALDEYPRLMTRALEALPRDTALMGPRLDRVRAVKRRRR